MIYTDLRDREAFGDPLKLLDMFGLLERIKHLPSKVSGGKQQRESLLQDPS
jgi:predicted ABC-type transport system involved in lysophospholipase L1 biosynthesis ATPase subunit